MTTPDNLAEGVRQHQLGNLAEAEKHYRAVLNREPEQPDALHLLGVIAHQLGKNDLAVDLIQRAIARQPADPESHNNLGQAFEAQGQLGDAEASYRRALSLQPEFAAACNNLGNVLHRRRALPEALAAYRRALQFQPDYAYAGYNLGNVLQQMGRDAEAIDWYRFALRHQPGLIDAANNLGNSLLTTGRIEEAVALFQELLRVHPRYAGAWSNFGNVLKQQGRWEEALAAFRRAVELEPGLTAAASNLLYSLHFHPDYNGRALATEHRHWYERHALPLRQLKPFANDRDPRRRLRVGYVSPDFYHQAESFFVVPLFAHHDHQHFEVHAYASVLRPDQITHRLRSHTDHWHDVCGWTDAAVAEKIRADGIDILVDLTMHMASNRLLLFARQPAPVQVTWLAYPGSTGLPPIGYRLTDFHMEPAGIDPDYSTERLARLPDSWCCYDPLYEAPACGPLPALTSAVVTFGSLNNPCKHNESVVRLWARVLHRVVRSRLLLLCVEGFARDRMRALFSRQGIPADRITFVAPQPRGEYLRTYQQIDLGLDPFPYNGITTTCDALWMGVPVLTRPGTTPSSRAGLSLLATAGLNDFAAESDDAFVELAFEKSRDLESLARLRAGLRAQVQASPLMDGPRFARNVESAFRSMWQTWTTEIDL